jgi:hypothetical protein
MVPGMTSLPNLASDNRPNIIRIEQNFYDQSADANNPGVKKNNRRKDNGKVPEKSLVTPLYKTRLCNFHMMGACHRGAGCSYAHGEQDLRPSPDFERTSVCPTMLKKGFCDKQHCRYAHNAEELRTQAGLLKTKMCNFYMKGLCVVGQACRFAHSKEELQEAMLVQKVAAPPPPTQPRCTDPELWESVAVPLVYTLRLELGFLARRAIHTQMILLFIRRMMPGAPKMRQMMMLAMWSLHKLSVEKSSLISMMTALLRR